jgi:hypothetical protein
MPFPASPRKPWEVMAASSILPQVLKRELLQRGIGSSHNRISKILRSEVMTPLVLGCVVILNLPVAEAETISTINPYHSSFSAKCSGSWDSNLPFDFVNLIARDSSATGVVSCQPDLSPDPLKTTDAMESGPAPGFDIQLYRSEDKLGENVFNRDVSIRELDVDRSYSGTDNCIYLDRDSQLLRADEDKNCGVFESGFDYTQLIGFLTLSIIAALCFAAVPLSWLLYRYYRARRLGTFVSAGLAASRSRVRRRRTNPPPLVAVPRQKLSSSSRGRHRHGRRKRVRADKGG